MKPWFASLRRPDWFVALAILAGGAVPMVGLYFLSTSLWCAVLAGVLAVPCGFIGGALATLGEQS